MSRVLAPPGVVREVRVTFGERELRLSNLDKVLYPSGFTKADVLDYYRRIAPALLPHLAGRPLTLKRYPDGALGGYFYEKSCPSHRPRWIPVAHVPSRERPAGIPFCLVEDLPSLMWVANLASLELHTPLARAPHVEQPTLLVFDLDPGPPADLVACARLAVELRDLLAHLGLDCLAKTSGKKGLQIYVPLNSPTTYHQTKPFAHAIARLLEERHPGRVVSVMRKDLRAGKVFVDWSQNDEHKTTVCVYSLRAGERPTVSMPLPWPEVERAARTGRARHLVIEAGQAVEIAEREGDRFRDALERTQHLPETAPVGAVRGRRQK